ncbi:DNA-3-methyladenine glycosylase II [Melghirimyces profundicolus]|uniref:DNA-3-methyladenine glycosylase II n=1 Tax=Melghirimyces profundicolus TaxID=1242148 RepID=A0A2T6BXF1_9BACL|nr:DNA-3-methyladenine glycosylase [Melghirimyces profundicolus]PTX60754.1 DNA-3-methyladenine glycosylase II [Melghirimyces profundicolus]
MTELRLEPAQPYSFERTTRRLLLFEKTFYRYRGGCFYRTLRLGHRPVTVKLDWEAGGVRVRVEEDLSRKERELLERLVRRMLSLNVDLQPFYEQMKKEPRLAPVIRARAGLHFMLDPTLYECLIKTIVSQQLNLSFAGTLIRRLVELAGETLEYGDERLPVFPTPEQVARLEYTDLQKLQFNRRKAEYIIDLSRMIADGRLDLEALERLPDEEVVERLVALRGVGRWTAECLLLFGMGRPNLLPAADIGLRNALKKLYGLAHQPTEAEVRQWGEDWAPWRSYVTFYLWDFLSG